MQHISDDLAVEDAQIVRPLTEINERECVAKWARKVKSRGLIVEIGTLFGGMTAVMGLANPQAEIITIDDFSWHPSDDVVNTPDVVQKNMDKVGVKNVKIVKGDSREIFKLWERKIDFAFIDGGHSYDWVYPDLKNTGLHSSVIALHDYKNPAWDTVERAVNQFLEDNKDWEIAEVVGWIVVLSKKSSEKPVLAAKTREREDAEKQPSKRHHKRGERVTDAS
jgi:hypothetical protein